MSTRRPAVWHPTLLPGLLVAPCGCTRPDLDGAPVARCEVHAARHRDHNARQVSRARREAVLARHRSCALCGLELVAEAVQPDPLATTVEHVVPWSQTRSHGPLVAAHSWCNGERGCGEWGDASRLVAAVMVGAMLEARREAATLVG